jgi:hypothetical protein
MQDFALLLGDCQIGFCQLPKWLTFSVVKNSKAEAINKQRVGQPMDCALSGECEWFDSNCRLLSIAARRAGFTATGCDEKKVVEFGGIKHEIGPRVTLLPSFGVSLKDIKTKITGDIVLLGGSKTSLILGGHLGAIGPVTVDGYSMSNGEEKLQHRTISNNGLEMIPIDPNSETDPAIAIRGFRLVGDQYSRVTGS